MGPLTAREKWMQEAPPPSQVRGDPPEEKTRSWVSLLVPQLVTLHFVMARCHRNEVSVVKVVSVVSVDKVVSVEMLRFAWCGSLSAATGPVTISGPVR